jgi:hypothetical protein
MRDFYSELLPLENMRVRTLDSDFVALLDLFDGRRAPARNEPDVRIVGNSASDANAIIGYLSETLTL